MTIPAQIPVTSSIANGVTTSFPYTFKILDADDLSVSVDGVIVTTGFTITGVGDDSGGMVIFDTAPASGKKIIRYLDPEFERVIDYQQFGDWLAAIVNGDFDRIWLALQFLEQSAVRTIKLPVDTLDSQEITEDADERANKVMAFDADGKLTLLPAQAGTPLADLSAPNGASLVGYLPAGDGAVPSNVQKELRRQNNQILQSSGPLYFESHIDAANHLKRFSVMNSSAGEGAVVGAATITAGVITDIPIIAGGNYYSRYVRVLITGDGTGAKAHATLAGAAITGIVIDDGGTGYSQADVYIVNGPVVVVAGDSISTLNPNPSIPSANMYSLLCREITAQNKLKSITFFNRAIGAQTWTSFNGTAATNLPDWYSNPAKPWIDYIKELQPDVVILAFGMNDRQNFVPAQMRAAINKLLIFSEVPDIILCTPLVPSAISSNADISSNDSQQGRDFVAGYIRSYAIVNNYACLDFNRQSRFVRDGYDVVSGVLMTEFEAQELTTPYEHDKEGYDFYISSEFTVSSGWWTNRKINYKLSRDGVNARQECRVEAASGKLKVSVVEISNGNVETITATATSSTDAPESGTAVINVQARSGSLIVTCNGITIFDGLIVRFGGIFKPKVTTLPDNVPVKLSLYLGKFATVNPRLSDLELWGTVPPNDYKGNALNHPTSIGVEYLFRPVIQSANFNYSAAVIGAGGNVGYGITTPLAKLHIRKTLTGANINPPSNANNLVLEDSINPGMTMLSESNGVSRIVSGDRDNTSQWVQSYNHNTDTYVEVLAGNPLRTLTAVLDTSLVPKKLYFRTKSTLPTPTGTLRGAIVYVSDDVGGETIAFCDGSNWRRVSDRAIIS